MPFTNSRVSQATREQIKAELHRKTKPKDIKRVYGVSLNTIYEYKRNLRHFGELRPASGYRLGPEPKLGAEIKEVRGSRGQRCLELELNLIMPSLQFN
jgi:transposase